MGILICAILAELVLQPADGLSRTSRTDTSAEQVYRKAKRSYDHLARDARLRKDRRAWIRVISAFRQVYLRHPENSGVAPNALYMMGRCYSELYGYSRKRADLDEAIERYQVLIERFPKSRLADDALYGMGKLYLLTGKTENAREAWSIIVREYARGDMVAQAKRAMKGLPPGHARRASVAPRVGIETQQKGREKGSTDFSPKISLKVPTGSSPAKVLAVRHWSATDYTRVVVDTSKVVSFSQGFLPADERRGLPRRFYMDLSPASRGAELLQDIRIGDGLLRGIRVGQHRPMTVRVVFDLGVIQNMKTFYLEDPFRVVVDVFGEGYPQGPTCDLAPPKGEKRAGQTKPLSLAQQLGLCVRRIVVDPGHGGKDPGAIGLTGLKEKDVVLKVAKKVASRLRDELGCEVIFTRTDDRFLTLEERTAIANARKADLFVSIHANSAPRRRLRGMETYYLNLAVDEDAMRVAARENATSAKRIGDLQKILNSLMRNAKVNESARLAEFVQEGMVQTLRQTYSEIKDLGVKQAPFFVLIGAHMPAVLAEVSFVSNKQEENRLRNDHYLDHVARGLIRGIHRYARETEMAYLEPRAPAM